MKDNSVNYRRLNMKTRFSNWVNSPITWKSYGKMCGLVWLVYLCIFIGWFYKTYEEWIVDWFKSKFRRHKKTEFDYNREES